MRIELKRQYNHFVEREKTKTFLSSQKSIIAARLGNEATPSDEVEIERLNDGGGQLREER